MSKSPSNRGPSQITLVNSQRLRALTSRAAESSPSVPRTTKSATTGEDAAARLQREINQHVAEILSQLPPGKQRSLFKIRYGLYPDQLQNLPPSEAARILRLNSGRLR